MKKGYIFLIIVGIILAILTIVGIVASQIELNTYVVDLRLEATSGYPPHLTVIINQGITKETALASIMPSLSLPSLSISEPHTTMSGIIKFDCGGSYQETRNFNLATFNPGDKMIQDFKFKDIPSESVCSIVARALECETQHIACTKNKISLIVKTP